MSINKAFSQIQLDNIKCYYLYSECVDNTGNCELLLSSMDCAYKSTFNLNQLKLDDNEWDHNKLNQFIEALRNGSKRVSSDNTIYNYDYSLVLNGNQIQLTIHLCIYQSDDDMEPFAKTPVISLPLERANEADIISSMFNKMLILFTENAKHIKTLENENKNLVDSCENAISKLDAFTVTKIENDAILFSKFCAVLNEKKDKIRQLQQQIN